VIAKLSSTCNITQRSATQLAQKLHKDGTAIITRDTLDKILPRYSTLREYKFDIGIFTDNNIRSERALNSTISWLYKVVRASDGLCRLICNSFTNHSLSKIMSLDGFMPKHSSLLLHNLLLVAMADNQFKARFAICYAISFHDIVSNFTSGHGLADCCFFNLSVQFLNREIYVENMVTTQLFFEKMSTIFKESLIRTTTTTNSTNTSTSKIEAIIISRIL
jgi:hypothetical protein